MATESRSPLFKNNVSNTSSAARCTFTWGLTHSQSIFAVKREKTVSGASHYGGGKAWEPLNQFLRNSLEVLPDKYPGHCNWFGATWPRWCQKYRSNHDAAERRHLEVGGWYLSSDSPNIRRDFENFLWRQLPSSIILPFVPRRHFLDLFHYSL